MLSKNIKEYRLEKGLSQAQLATQVGVSQGAVYFWEKGINEPTASCVVKLAKAFGVTVDELLEHDSGGKESLSENEKKMNRYFSLLSPKQQEMVLEIVSEFIKQ